MECVKCDNPEYDTINCPICMGSGRVKEGCDCHQMCDTASYKECPRCAGHGRLHRKKKVS